MAVILGIVLLAALAMRWSQLEVLEAAITVLGMIAVTIINTQKD